jgi:hypothetical protein
MKMMVICLTVIPILWYLTYAPLHELSHSLGTYLAGGKVVDVKLIPSFWMGEFAVAWIKLVGLSHPRQNLVMLSAPYVLDLASIIAGADVLQRRMFKTHSGLACYSCFYASDQHSIWSVSQSGYITVLWVIYFISNRSLAMRFFHHSFCCR